MTHTCLAAYCCLLDNNLLLMLSSHYCQNNQHAATSCTRRPHSLTLTPVAATMQRRTQLHENATKHPEKQTTRSCGRAKRRHVAMMLEEEHRPSLCWQGFRRLFCEVVCLLCAHVETHINLLVRCRNLEGLELILQSKQKS